VILKSNLLSEATMTKEKKIDRIEENEEESSTQIYDEDEARMILGI
jgi:hypothetical protein